MVRRVRAIAAPGAGGRLPRSTAFFDGRGAGQALVVRTGRAFGVLLCLVGNRRLARRGDNSAIGDDRLLVASR